MRLTELDGQFFRIVQAMADITVVDGDPATWQERGCPTRVERRLQTSFHTVGTFAEADGVRFLCPKCFAENHGKVGTHGCHVYFAGRNSSADINEGVRWTASGTGLHDLTTTPSVLLLGGCAWHGFITNGEVI